MDDDDTSENDTVRVARETARAIVGDDGDLDVAAGMILDALNRLRRMTTVEDR